jgi:flavin-binding protein dodecin
MARGTLNEEGNEAGGRKLASRFEGVSAFNDTSSATDLHEAIQQAAKAAATELGLTPEDTRVFEITKIQVEVGNPNVKVYRVEMKES